MMTGSDEITRLREAFSACDASAAAAGNCPPAEKIWEALRGELPPDQVREVVDHTSGCASCAADWRLAHALEKQSGDAIAVPEAAAVRRARFRTLQPWLAAAAAVAVIVVGVRWSEWGVPGQEPVLRDGTEQTAMAIRSLIPEEQALSRQHCLLRWSGPEDAYYRIEVSTEQLEIIATEQDLRTREYLVPESSLARYPNATKLLWLVDAVLPDGSRVDDSMTFVAVLE